MKNEKGFSLVELLVVVIIIAIIAAIAIPSLLASRRAANEASAISSLRTIHSAQATYFSTSGGNTNYSAVLTGANSLGAAGLIDSALASGSKSGYTFAMSNAAGIYCATGLATTFGTTGSRDFGVDNTGVIRATPTDGDATCALGVLAMGANGVVIQ